MYTFLLLLFFFFFTSAVQHVWKSMFLTSWSALKTRSEMQTPEASTCLLLPNAIMDQKLDSSPVWGNSVSPRAYGSSGSNESISKGFGLTWRYAEWQTNSDICFQDQTFLSNYSMQSLSYSDSECSMMSIQHCMATQNTVRYCCTQLWRDSWYLNINAFVYKEKKMNMFDVPF